jgi:hypothetical protein
VAPRGKDLNSSDTFYRKDFQEGFGTGQPNERHDPKFCQSLLRVYRGHEFLKTNNTPELPTSHVATIRFAKQSKRETPLLLNSSSGEQPWLDVPTRRPRSVFGKRYPYSNSSAN